MLPTILFFALMLAMLIRYVLDRRQAVAIEVVSTLSACMKQGLPLPDALHAAASGSGAAASPMIRIAVLLAEGRGLGEAIRRGCRSFPGFALGLIVAAEKTNQLPAALVSLEADLAERRRQKLRIRPAEPLYAMMVLGALALVVTLMMVFVMPKFKDIFRDMGRHLPPTTRVLMENSGYIALAGPVVILVGVVWLYAMLRVRRPGRPGLILRLGDLLKWSLPLFHRLELGRGQMQAVEALRLGLAGGLTLDAAIECTLDLDVNICYRRRLRRWLRRVRGGQEASAAARACGVGHTLAWAFDPEVNRGNTPQVLAMLESAFRANHDYLANMVKMVAMPVVVLLLALLVGLVVFALYAPMLALVRAVSHLP